MKFYLIHIQTVGESTAKELFEYSDQKSAEVAFHSTVAYDMSNEAVVSSLTCVMNETGYVYPELTKNYKALEE